MLKNKKEIAKLSLEEKAGLLSGANFWRTKEYKEAGVNSIWLSDGPHGLRKKGERNEGLGLDESVPATCYPTACALASSWDEALVEEVGAAIGDQAAEQGVSAVLGPGANIKRSPLCGRNFEYFSEDPYLSSRMAAAHIKGVQSAGVGASLKHFAANNQERFRMSTNVLVSRRALREIYLKSFEYAVKAAKPWTVMCSYNRINGVFSSDNEWLLERVLRREWGFEGLVVSDWGAVNDRVQGVKAGLDLEMPYSGGVTDEAVAAAVKAGELEESAVDACADRVISLVKKAESAKKPDKHLTDAQRHELARKAAAGCAVLLKNDGALPIAGGKHIAVIGDMARLTRYQGGGSSHVNAQHVESALGELAVNASIDYARGYALESDDTDDALVYEAIGAASMSDAAVIFAGLPERIESEGYDRANIDLPANQNELIARVAKVCKTIVVLYNGAPVAMPWIEQVSAVLEMYLGGEGAAGAAVDVLFGRVQPSGRLAETFPVRAKDNPSFLNFPGTRDSVSYGEGIFVGYRYYDAAGVKPLFPFGHGLSYTRFEYSDLSVSKQGISESESVRVELTLKNTGERDGYEVVQLYAGDCGGSVQRAPKELKGFKKVFLRAGEQTRLDFTLNGSGFAYYNEAHERWAVQTGEYSVLVGASSADIRLSAGLKIQAEWLPPVACSPNTTVGEALRHKNAEAIKQVLARGFDMASGDETVLSMIEAAPIRALIAFSDCALKQTDIDEIMRLLAK